MQVSDPQRLTIPNIYVEGFVAWLRQRGLDAHEFAKSYVDRTEQLGYAPDLKLAAEEFVREMVG